MSASPSSAGASNRFVESLEGRRLLSGGGGSLFLPPAPVTRVPPVNGGFEAFPDLTGWQTAGNDSIVDQSFYTAPEGAVQVAISNGGAGATAPVSASALSTFLGLKSANDLKVNGKQAVNGSAIKQTVTAGAFDILSFKADFLSNETTRGGDYAFVSLTDAKGKTQLFKLSDFTKATSPLVFAGTSLARETGYRTYALLLPKSGQYTVGFGVVNVGDASITSTLLVDNVQLTPFPIVLNVGGKGKGDDKGGDKDKDKSNSSDDAVLSAS